MRTSSEDTTNPGLNEFITGVIPGPKPDPFGVFEYMYMRLALGRIPLQVPSASTRCWLVALNPARCRTHLLAPDT